MKNILIAAFNAGIALQLEDGELRINAPKGALTEELREGFKQYKDEIIEHLRLAAASNDHQDDLSQIIANPASRFEPFPLTDIQHAYWLGRSQPSIDLGGVSTHLYYECVVEHLDLERFQSCLDILIQRHDMLRAVINAEGVQQVLPELPPYVIDVLDLQKIPASQQMAHITAVRDEMSHQVLPADCAPVMDIRASLESAVCTRLHISLDMLILDAWSMMLLFREWKQLYDYPHTLLPPLTVTYRDYALAEAQLQQTPQYQRAKNYWWERIDRLPPAPQIPIVQKGAAAETLPVFSRRSHEQSAARWQCLQDQGKAIGLTPSGLILAIFAEAVTLWSNTSHYSLNVTLFNRQALHPQVNSLLGDFTSMMLLEVDHRQTGTSFRTRAINLQQRFIKDLEYREISGLEVMREMRRRRGAAMEATMPVVFTSALVYAADGGDMGLLEAFGPMDYGISQTPQVCLDHQVMERNGHLVCNWDCVDERFEAGTIDGLYHTFEQLLERLVDEPDCWEQEVVACLPASQLVSRNQLNRTIIDEPPALGNETLHRLFVQQALRFPEAIALIDHSGLEISYGRLLAISHQLAQPLIAQGVQADQRVAIVMEKGWEQVAAVLAVHLAGAAYLPISPRFPKQRQHLLMAQGGAQAVLTQPHLYASLSWPEGCRPLLVEYDSTLDYLQQPPAQRQSADNLAYILFTSGSTGIPKAVMIEHRQALNTIYHVNKVLGVTAKDRVLGVSALSFDLSVYDIFGPLTIGGTLVIPESRQATDPKHWQDLMDRYGVTLWNSAPALMGMLVDYLDDSGRQPATAALRQVWMSGDRIPVPLPDRIRTHFPEAKVVSLGGPTETAIWSVYYPIDKVDPSWSSIPYGKPLPNQQLYILNRYLEPTPVGVVGIIYIGGRGLGRGYLNDTEKTEQLFIQHPTLGERLYRSGDMGRYWADGTIEILGRDDFQVKIRGYRIELEEITTLLNRHPDIKQAVVTSTPDVNNHRQLVAYIEPRSVTLASDDDAACALSALQNAASAMDDAAVQALDQVYYQALIYAFRQLGVRGLTQEVVSSEQLLQNRVLPEYQHWLQRGFAYLVARGDADYTHQTATTITLLRDLPPVAGEGLARAITAIFDRDSDGRSDMDWLLRNAEELASLLQGELSPTDFYYLGASQRCVEQRLLGDGLEQLQRWLEATLIESGDRDFSVFEIGAGVGSVTESLLPLILQYNKSYLITEADEPHLDYLYDQFNNNANEALAFGFFTLEETLDAQEVQAHSVDVLICANTLYRSRDLTTSLLRARQLLKPGGHLVLLEPMQYRPSLDLHLGLQRDGLAANDDALPDVSAWAEALTSAGFSDYYPLPLQQAAGVSVLIADVPAAVVVDSKQVKQYLSEQLPRYMVPAHIISLGQLPLSVNGKVDINALPHIDDRASSGEKTTTAPRNATEEALYHAWSTVLMIDDFGVDDNFFDLGGNSINAVGLVRNINQYLPDFHLEMHEFFDCLTIEKLCALLKSRALTKDLRDCHQPIAKGVGRAYFLIAPNNAEKNCYDSFAKQLLAPVYRLYPQQDVAEWNIDVVRQLACDYIRDLKHCQPQGPYALGGWSMGGLIAYEMSVQLEAAGENVNSLLLMDTPSPAPHTIGTLRDMMTWFFSRRVSADTLVQLGQLDAPGTLLVSAAEYFTSCVRLVNQLEHSQLQVKQLWPEFLRILSLVNTISDYPPTPIAANILSFKPKDSVFPAFACHPDKHHSDWGWQALSSGRVDHYFLPGDHFAVIRGAGVILSEINVAQQKHAAC
ncbi:MAG: amino acid adenylation domain-containing protein [Cellvibrionaceae bacterium]|nr:amino acid adenylation domain-containing protein [Cellvibrionaceae bacterium]